MSLAALICLVSSAEVVATGTPTAIASLTKPKPGSAIRTKELLRGNDYGRKHPRTSWAVGEFQIPGMRFQSGRRGRGEDGQCVQSRTKVGVGVLGGPRLEDEPGFGSHGSIRAA